MPFVVISPRLTSDHPIPVRYTCDGENLSPPLAWAHAPREAHAFAVLMDDPDAPGGTFTHWMLSDLPATCASLDEGLEPHGQGTPGVNGFGRLGYGGPCPPRGDGPHHYRFHVIALTQRLHLQPGFTRTQFDAALAHAAIATAALIGTYQRTR